MKILKSNKFILTIKLLISLFLISNLLFSQNHLAPIPQGNKTLEEQFSKSSIVEWSQFECYDITTNTPENHKLLYDFLTQPIYPEDNELGGYRNYMERMNNIIQNEENRLKLEKKGIFIPPPDTTNVSWDAEGVYNFLNYIVSNKGKIFTITKNNKIIGLMPVIEKVRSLVMLPICISPKYEYSTKTETFSVPILDEINKFLKLSGHMYANMRAFHRHIDEEFSLNRESGRTHEMSKSKKLNLNVIPTEVVEKRCNQDFIPIENFSGIEENVVSFKIVDPDPQFKINKFKLEPVCSYKKKNNDIVYFDYDERYFYPLTAEMPGMETITSLNQKDKIKKLRKKIFKQVNEKKYINADKIINIKLPSTFKDTVTLNPKSRKDLNRIYDAKENKVHFDYEPRIYITKRNFTSDTDAFNQINALIKNLLLSNIDNNLDMVNSFIISQWNQRDFGGLIKEPIPNMFQAPYINYFIDHFVMSRVLKSPDISRRAKLDELTNIIKKVINKINSEYMSQKAIENRKKTIEDVQKYINRIKYKYFNIHSKQLESEEEIQKLIELYTKGNKLFVQPLSTRTYGDFKGSSENPIVNLVNKNINNYTIFVGEKINKIHGKIIRDCKIKGDVEGYVDANFKEVTLSNFELTNATIKGILKWKETEIKINETNFTGSINKDFKFNRCIFTGKIKGNIKGNINISFDDINEREALEKQKFRNIKKHIEKKEDEKKLKSLKELFSNNIINGYLDIELIDASYASLNFDKELRSNLFTTEKVIIAASLIKEEILTDEEIENIVSQTDVLYKKHGINIREELEKRKANINNDYSIISISPKTGGPTLELGKFAEFLFGISAQKIFLLSLTDPDRPFLTHTWAPSDGAAEGTFVTLLKTHQELIIDRNPEKEKAELPFSVIINNPEFTPFVSFIRDIGARGKQIRNFNILNSKQKEIHLKKSKNTKEPVMIIQVKDLKISKDCQINDEDWNNIKDLYIIKSKLHFQNFLDLNNKPLIKGFEKNDDGIIKTLKIEGIVDQISMLCLLNNQKISNILYESFISGTVVFIEKLIYDKNILPAALSKLFHKNASKKDIKELIEEMFANNTNPLEYFTALIGSSG